MGATDVITFLDRFRRNVERVPSRSALVFCQGSREADGERVVTYAELDRAARSRATWLLGRLRPGDRALLLHPDGLEFARAFLGCLYAGVVPVPAPVPRADGRGLRGLAALAADAEPAVVLTEASLAEQLRAQLAAAGVPEERVVASDTLPDSAEGWTPPRLTARSLAVLQYTSGSTSDPKGVMVTHGSLAANLDAMDRQTGSGDADVIVSWLPHFHDMGLVGMTLQPLAAGGTSVFMAPMSFLRRPVRWLEAVSRWRGGFSAAPNFAYDLCTQMVTAEQSAGLDLSSWRGVLNGAEPVRARTLDAFARRFEPNGFRRDAFMPCYGMAEVTLLAASTRSDASPVVLPVDAAALERNRLHPDPEAGAVRLTGCGAADPRTLRIVDPVTRVGLPDGQVGEIWLSGPSVTAGYWRRPELTAEVFAAETADGGGPCLRTGDLGAVLDGQLYVTGRLKDVVIVNGRNLYPQDIEQAVAEMHPALAGGSGAVFGIPGDREHVVVVHEVTPGRLGGVDPAELAARVKAAVGSEFELAAASVVLVARGAVRRTTSGKIRRALMRTLFLESRLAALHEDVVPAVADLRAERSPQAAVPVG